MKPCSNFYEFTVLDTTAQFAIRVHLYDLSFIFNAHDGGPLKMGISKCVGIFYKIGLAQSSLLTREKGLHWLIASRVIDCYAHSH